LCGNLRHGSIQGLACHPQRLHLHAVHRWALQKGKDYASWHQFNGKPSDITGCPGGHCTKIWSLLRIVGTIATLVV